MHEINEVTRAMQPIERITLNVSEVAQLLGTSATTIYTGCREGDIPHFRVRGKILFNREVIEAWTRGEYQQEKVHA